MIGTKCPTELHGYTPCGSGVVEMAEEICDFCDGTGAAMPEGCETCDGFGWVHDTEDDGTMTCPECEGMAGEECGECDDGMIYADSV